MEMDLREARSVIARAKEGNQKREFKGANWPLHFKMAELRSNVYRGVRQLPNLKEITAEEFAAHPCISGSYAQELLGGASCEHMEGIKYVRYARVLMEVGPYNAGRGVAFVAVPRDRNDWDKSQHGTVPLTLRYWSFHICDHHYKQVEYRNCVTTYKCDECGWMLEVDSS